MAIDKMHIRTQYAKIVLLTFDELPIAEIQGSITSGTLSVNGTSAIRRTISLTMLADATNANIEDATNQMAITIDKKVRIEIGLKNTIKSYESYGEIIWYPCGTFILSSASVARNTNNWTISISGKDKMCLLDGSVGGTLPASTTFHERYIELSDGDFEIQNPTIFQIIFEAVNHWGGEAADRIIISDIDETAKMLVRYEGDRPIYFSENYSSISNTYDETNFPYVVKNGDDAGYEVTDFTYPGELVLNAGDTVVTLLDKIVKTLGNFEYFYDLDGNFVFQEIKNYLNQQSPLLDLKEEDYVKSYSNKKFLYSLTDLDTTTAITRAPKFDNIKNDFYVWGKRETLSDAEVDIRYHLAIDTKPILDMATQYMWEIRHKDSDLILRYEFTDTNSFPSGDDIAATLTAYSEFYLSRVRQDDEVNRATVAKAIENIKSVGDGSLVSFCFKQSDAALGIVAGQTYYTKATNINAPYTVTLVGGPCDEWREELYRQALEAQVTNSVYNSYYDSELIAEWRNLYDPTNDLWPNGWNPDVLQNPNLLNFWLDFIDSGSEIGKYSIGQIGRRTKVVNNNQIKTIYNKEVPDVVFIENTDQETRSELTSKYNALGQKYFFLTPQYYDLFTLSTTGASCFDEIRNLLYQHLNYNTTITLTCLPKYYMEPHNIIYIEDADSGIAGNFEITQFTLPLAYNGTMNITATEVLTRI